MIFITLGSQKFQFNRLLIYIDKLIDDGVIQEEVFAQKGNSNYIPKNYNFVEFLERTKFQEKMEEAEFVVTHGGTGAIVTALNNNKKVIAVPRLAKFDEHVDDHQIQIVEAFSNANYIMKALDYFEFEQNIKKIKKMKFDRFKSNNNFFVAEIIRLIKK
ncbi:hypothetical protein IGI67_003039 [Enterococcus sp. AZ196]